VNVTRISPADLLHEPYHPFVRQLCLQWTNARLTGGATHQYTDYLTTINTLLLTTQDPDRTRLIFTSVLSQAVQLGRSSLWVEQELQFEGMLHGADRVDFLRLDLAQTASGNQGFLDDATLDRYNERLARLTPPDHDH